MAINVINSHDVSQLEQVWMELEGSQETKLFFYSKMERPRVNNEGIGEEHPVHIKNLKM